MNYARQEPGVYWKSIMKEEPIPEAISKLFLSDDSISGRSKSDRFVTDFDIRHSVIIYHNHLDHKDQQKKDFVEDMMKPRYDEQYEQKVKEHCTTRQSKKYHVGVRTHV